MGESPHIGAGFYTDLAKSENLMIQKTPEDGLLENFNALKSNDFDPSKVAGAIRDFYEHTSRYELEAWSESKFPTRFFLFILTRFVSRKMDQLNFPVSSLELAGGMTSEVLPMLDSNGMRRYTGWLRKFTLQGKVIYTGLYSVERPPHASGPCVKVSFPLPFGSSTVFLVPSADHDGSFRLTSSGSGFGYPGFYRMVVLNKQHWRVRYIRTLREVFHVYVDKNGVLRTDHKVAFLGLPVLKLHYKIKPISNPLSSP